MSETPAPVIELRERNTFSIGLLIGISSWAMIFVTLVWGYVVFRMRSSGWFGESMTPLVRALGVTNTIVMALSSWSLSVAFKQKNIKAKFWAWGAFVLGLVFLVGQFELWQMLLNVGLHWQTSIAGSFFFLLTGFHALHIVGALIAVLILCSRFPQWQGTLVGTGIKYFWDFLLFVWLVMFVLIFIIQ